MKDFLFFLLMPFYGYLYVAGILHTIKFILYKFNGLIRYVYVLIAMIFLLASIYLPACINYHHDRNGVYYADWPGPGLINILIWYNLLIGLIGIYLKSRMKKTQK